jgi:hypothetical protein
MQVRELPLHLEPSGSDPFVSDLMGYAPPAATAMAPKQDATPTWDPSVREPTEPPHGVLGDI